MSYLALFNESFACSERAQELSRQVDMDQQRSRLRNGMLLIGTFVSTGLQPTSSLRSIASSLRLTRADYDRCSSA